MEKISLQSLTPHLLLIFEVYRIYISFFTQGELKPTVSGGWSTPINKFFITCRKQCFLKFFFSLSFFTTELWSKYCTAIIVERSLHSCIWSLQRRSLFNIHRFSEGKLCVSFFLKAFFLPLVFLFLNLFTPKETFYL